MPDDLSDYLEKKDIEWENLCVRCGSCCGAYEDPCKHLKRDGRGKYYCEIYDNRFGLRESVGGEKFYCVPVKQIIHQHWKNDHLCACKKHIWLTHLPLL